MVRTAYSGDGRRERASFLLPTNYVHVDLFLIKSDDILIL